MVRSVRHKGLRGLFERGERKALSAAMVRRLENQLTQLHAAAGPEGMDGFPGWKLHPLKGDLRGFWSVWVTGNWRLVFRFANGDAWDVDLVDYHGG